MIQRNKRIAFLVPYPINKAPSQRFRLEQYFSFLKHSCQICIYPFLSDESNSILYKPGYILKKIGVLAIGFGGRLMILFKISSFDYIFIHREATPIGPPIIEWLIAKILRKKIIYDFDDAIWVTDRVQESFLLQTIKWRSKVKTICSWAHKVSCGNEYLCSFSKQFNSNVVYNPTTIDTEQLHNPSRYAGARGERKNSITIGWTGSHSTLKYLGDLEPVLQQLEKKYPEVEFCVIADKAPSLKLARLHFVPWAIATEIADLSTFDIGIMPLPNDEWAKGKCGFKALQYMALEIPTVVSPVGVNGEIIQHAVNGFLASEADEWLAYLEKLILDKELRKKIGTKGRETVIAHYSVLSNSSTFLSLFE